MDVTVTIAGEAGQGIQTLGTVLCKAISRDGGNVFATQDYMSRVRGGCNFFSIRISDVPRQAQRARADILIILDDQFTPLHQGLLADHSLVISGRALNENGQFQWNELTVPFDDLAKSAAGASLYKNSVACGVIMGIMKVSRDTTTTVLKATFASKGDDTVNKNIDAMREGYRFAEEHHTADTFQSAFEKKKTAKTLLSGNQAAALAALHAGCTFYSAYPMSPATGILTTMAHYADRFGVFVEQAEDEIAAINMVIGASFAGARSMTATSGGGFALMGEGISLAAMTETPVVVVNAQRPAPATGLPTRTEQADLNLVLHAGHGEFARVLYTPGSVEELFVCVVMAFDNADTYQIPAFILTDQYLADTVRNVTLPDMTDLPRKRNILEREDATADYKRYCMEQGVVSPRAIPGRSTDALVYADSDEHTEAGHITEDGEIRSAMVWKRFQEKMHLLERETMEPVCVLPERTELILLGFGSTKGVVAEAADALESIAVGCIHFPQVWPFPAGAFSECIEQHPDAKIVSVENNAGAQLAGLIRKETGIRCDTSILKYNGRPFTVDELVATVNERYV